jgi:hypothetical protein
LPQTRQCDKNKTSGHFTDLFDKNNVKNELFVVNLIPSVHKQRADVADNVRFAFERKGGSVPKALVA